VNPFTGIPEEIMRRWPSLIPLALLAATIVLAGACSSGGGDSSSRQPGGYSDLLASNAGEALGNSADRFSSDVQTGNADFTFNVSAGGFKISASGDFAFKQPDQMHMNMKLDSGGLLDFGALGNIEMLVSGGQVYMNTASTGWLVLNFDDLGPEGAQFKDMLSGHSPVDYKSLIDGLGDVQNLGDEQIGGHTYTHLRVNADLKDVMKAVADTLGGSASDLPTEAAAPLTMDIWVDPATLLPGKVVAQGQFDLKDLGGGSGVGGPLSLEMVINFRDYNGAVNIPAPPANAQPFKDAAGLGAGNDTPY